MTVLGKIRLPLEHNGLRLEYAPACIAYVLSWKDVLLRIIQERNEAIAEFQRLTVAADLEADNFKIGGTE